MQFPNLILIYVDDPLKSAQFYEQLFGCQPAAVFPTYAAFQFPNGLNFGLWSSKAQNFVSDGKGHRSELAFMVPNEDLVRAMRNRWHDAGVTIEQDLHLAVFGLTFVAQDLDGHRIRVCMPDD